MKRERKKENKEKVEELENGRRISGGKKKWWKWRGDEKNLSFDECWPATLVCSQPSHPHYNRLIKSQRVRIPLASIRLRQGFHKNRFLTDSFQSNRGYSRYTKSHRRATRVQTPAISKWTTFRLTTWNCSPGNPYRLRDFPFSFIHFSSIFFVSPFPRVFNFLPYFSKFSKFSFSTVHLNGTRSEFVYFNERAQQIKNSLVSRCGNSWKIMWQQNGFSFWF